MLTTPTEYRRYAEAAAPSVAYPHDFEDGVPRRREHESFTDFILDRDRRTTRRATVLADLWRIYQEMKAVDPNVTDREVVRAYHDRHPERPHLTTTALRNLRYRRRKRERRQVAVGATSR